MRALLLALALVGLTSLLFANTATDAAPTIGRYGEFGDSGGFMNILPPGQDGVVNGPEAIAAQFGQMPPHFSDQLAMYGDLVYNTPGLTEDRLSEFFKDASFGVPEDDIARVYSPTAGVTVVRDESFGVPHIFGETRYATMFAQGYTGAEDRLFLMDVLRHVGRARLSEFLGASPSNLDLDRDQIAVAPYREADLTRQLNEAIAASGPEGQAIYQDLLAYVDGVNQYIREALLDPLKLPAEYPALQQVPAPWIPEDTVAIASLVGGIFGKGGGGEVTNFCGLQAMTDELGSAADARRIFDDLHFADDPEAPTTSSRPASYLSDLGPVNPAAIPDLDCSELVAVDDYASSPDDAFAAITGDNETTHIVDAPWGSFILDFGDHMSNALLVSGTHTQTGSPIAVFGPQTGYFAPQLLVEKDVHGPGIDARGAAFAGTDIFVQLGRGRDYAWSATSAGADNIDQFILRLCEPDGGTPTIESMGYLRNGDCQPIETYQHTQIAKPSAGGQPAGPDIVLSWRVERTEDYGPVSARGLLTDGTPVAVATLRSTYNNELGSARGFYRINNPDYMAGGFDAFRQAMSTGVDYTFNWFYIDDSNIGYQHSCRCPQRAQGVDPYLPAWGTGEWDWRGFIPASQQPWDLNPAQGYITSWNNKQAPGWTANDRDFYYGPNYRSQLLDLQIDRAIAAGKLDRADLVVAMEEAGTVDLRGQEVLPLLLDVLGTTAPAGSDPRAQEMRDRLAAWAAADAHRRDHDASGEYDDPQSPAIIDAWWTRLSHAIFDAPSGNAIANLRITLDDHNRIDHLGSAFQDGTYGHVNKDLRQVLGRKVTGPFSQTYCGGGDLAACRALLWESLGQAAADLQAEFNSPNVAGWKRAMADEDVRHSAVGVVEVPAIHWINRPTFQQVVQIPRPTEVAAAKGAGTVLGADSKKISFHLDASALSNGEVAGTFRLDGRNARINVKSLSSAASPAGDGCGAVPAGGASTLELRGTGTFNGAGAHAIHVCVQDNAEPGRAADIIHVDCATCPFATASEVLASGNIRVISSGASSAPAPPAAAENQPSVVVLEPFFGLSAVPGQPVALTATVYDAAGEPLAGAPVGIAGTSVAGITNSAGQAVLPLTLGLGSAGELSAQAGGVESNVVRVTLK